MRRSTFCLVAVVAVAGSAAVALGGDTAVKVKGVGSAKIRWNAVTYREELVAQLAPGLTWRLGKGDATRLALRKMALVAPNAMLLPGDMTLNLRYWSRSRWELVVFEENRWSWGEDVTMLALLNTEVGKEPDDKKAAESLVLELRNTVKGNRSPTPGGTLTGGGGGADVDALADDVAYSPEARKEFDAVPEVELHMRFGPNHAICRFDVVKVAKLESRRKGSTGKKGKLRLVYARHTGVLARTEWLEKHEGELTFAVVDQGWPGDKPVVLTLTGGDEPMLWPVLRSNGEELDAVAGRKVVTKKTPKSLEAELEDGRLTVHLAKLDYVFDL